MKCSLCPAEATRPFSEAYYYLLCDRCFEVQHAALSRIAQQVRVRNLYADERERVGWSDETALEVPAPRSEEGK